MKKDLFVTFLQSDTFGFFLLDRTIFASLKFKFVFYSCLFVWLFSQSLDLLVKMAFSYSLSLHMWHTTVENLLGETSRRRFETLWFSGKGDKVEHRFSYDLFPFITILFSGLFFLLNLEDNFFLTWRMLHYTLLSSP